ETGGKIAVAESARNIVCSGAKPLALTDGLNFGNPTDPEVFWQMEESIDGISAARRELDTPVISGDVSLYNQSKGEAIFPTPIIGMVGLLESVDHLSPSHFQQADDLIYLIGETEIEFGGSELQKVLNNSYSGKAPKIDLKEEAKRQKQILKAIQEGLIVSATDISEGGLAVALAENTFTEQGLGLTVRSEEHTSELQSRYD